MPNTLPSAATHYRALALDAYAAAKLIEDPHNRRIMERVALGYENLAAHAEARARTAELVASIITPDEKLVWRTSIPSRPIKGRRFCA